MSRSFDKLVDALLEVDSQIETEEDRLQLVLALLQTMGVDLGELFSDCLKSELINVECRREHLDELGQRAQALSMLSDLGAALAGFRNELVSGGVDPERADYAVVNLSGSVKIQ